MDDSPLCSPLNRQLQGAVPLPCTSSLTLCRNDVPIHGALPGVGAPESRTLRTLEFLVPPIMHNLHQFSFSPQPMFCNDLFASGPELWHIFIFILIRKSRTTTPEENLRPPQAAKHIISVVGRWLCSGISRIACIRTRRVEPLAATPTACVGSKSLDER